MDLLKKKTGFLPYGRQDIDQNDIDAVVEILKSDWLTQGPTIERFEDKLKERLGADRVITCANGTAALHLTMMALDLKPDDVVLTTPITFMASANCARFVGAKIGFVDIDYNTGLISYDKLEEAIIADKNKNIRAVVPVHLTGHPVDLPKISKFCVDNDIDVIDDCCHALGARFEYQGKKYNIGGNGFAKMSAFSFHPVKHIATGEGGAVATGDKALAEKLYRFRNHGINRERFINKDMAYASDSKPNPWYHEMQDLCPNCRLTDIQAALGISQLNKLDYSLQRRNEIAKYYSTQIEELFDEDEVRPLKQKEDAYNAYHLYVLQINFDRFKIERAELMNKLRERNIGTQVHYIPIHLQPYYRNLLGTKPGDFPNAEKYYERALSIPMYPQLTESDCDRVLGEIKEILCR